MNYFRMEVMKNKVEPEGTDTQFCRFTQHSSFMWSTDFQHLNQLLRLSEQRSASPESFPVLPVSHSDHNKQTLGCRATGCFSGPIKIRLLITSHVWSLKRKGSDVESERDDLIFHSFQNICWVPTTLFLLFVWCCLGMFVSFLSFMRTIQHTCSSCSSLTVRLSFLSSF